MQFPYKAKQSEVGRNTRADCTRVQATGVHIPLEQVWWVVLYEEVYTFYFALLAHLCI